MVLEQTERNIKMLDEKTLKEKIPHVSRETIEKIESFKCLYEKWGKSINLSSSYDMTNFLDRHILDSIQLSNLISMEEDCLDIGSGGGFPGIVLSILGQKMTLCEINSKKISFLEESRRRLGLNFKIINESAYKISTPYSFVVSRAFSSLTNLLEIQKNVSRETTVGVFPKGKSYEIEIEEAKKKWNFDIKLLDSAVHEMSKIIIVSNVRLKEVERENCDYGA